MPGRSGNRITPSSSTRSSDRRAQGELGTVHLRQPAGRMAHHDGGVHGAPAVGMGDRRAAPEAGGPSTPIWRSGLP